MRNSEQQEHSVQPNRLDPTSRRLLLFYAALTSVLISCLVLRPWKRVDGEYGDIPQFYAAGRLAATGQIDRLYDAKAYVGLLPEDRSEKAGYPIYFNRPAFEAFLFTPAGFLSYKTFETLFVSCNYVLLGLLVWLLPKWFSTGPSTRIWLLSYAPFAHAIFVGQDTLALTLAAASGIRLTMLGRDYLAGALLAVGLYKPHILWAVPIVLLARGRWKSAAAFGVVAVALAAISFAAVGTSGIGQWAELLRRPTTDNVPETMGNIRSLAMRIGPVPAFGVALLALVGFAACVLKKPLVQALACAIFLGPIMAPHSYLYDYSPAASGALLCPSPVMRWLILLPWPYLYPGLRTALPYLMVGVLFVCSTAMRSESTDHIRFLGLNGTSGRLRSGLWRTKRAHTKGGDQCEKA